MGVEELLEQADSVGVFPHVVRNILDVVRDPQSTVRDLEKAVALDPVLSVRLLKIANSSFYGLPRKVTSLRDAIQLMGFLATKDLAIAVLIGNTAQSAGKLGVQLWNHSLKTGVASRLLARHVRTVPADEALLTGMLHDIGILILLITRPLKYRRLLETLGVDSPKLHRAERVMFRFDHAELGAAALKRWQLPDTCCEIVANHHGSPSTAGGHVLDLAEHLVRDPDADDLTAHPSVGKLRLVPFRVLTTRRAYLEEVDSLLSDLKLTSRPRRAAIRS